VAQQDGVTVTVFAFDISGDKIRQREFGQITPACHGFASRPLRAAIIDAAARHKAAAGKGPRQRWS
jgi:hypothetical protein